MAPSWTIVTIFFCGLVTIARSQVVTLIAGSENLGHADGVGAAALFNRPAFVAATSTDLYVADYGNNLIRQINLAYSAVTTLAGGGSSGTLHGHADGVGAAATFNGPYGIAVSSTDLYIADSGNNLIRHINLTTAAVTTLAGGGSSGTDYGHVDGLGVRATFVRPMGLAVSGTMMYICDTNNRLMRLMDLTANVVTTLAGQGSVAGQVDGIGAAATFMSPVGAAVSGNDLYISDAQTIRHIDLTTIAVTTIAGGGSAGSSFFRIVDGIGKAANFCDPAAMTILGGLLFIADECHRAIRQLDPVSLAVTTFASGSLDWSPSQLFDTPTGIASTGSNLYISDSGSCEIKEMTVSVATTANPPTAEPTTAEPTTPVPSTAVPPTPVPSTAKPTTPTTAVPPTPVPSTAKPTTPTTAVPPTPVPTTAKPTTPTTAVPPTPVPSTAVPPTANPTTAQPTTAKPTTAKPTTAKPTTAKPTTAKPTTAKPTTAKPTTAKPTTAKPTTAKPTTAKPTTTKPTTAKPTTAKPNPTTR